MEDINCYAERLWGFVSSGDFSCTINISSQTRRRLITSFLLEHTLNNSSAQIYPLILNIWKPWKAQRAVKKIIVLYQSANADKIFHPLKIWVSASTLPPTVSQFKAGFWLVLTVHQAPPPVSLQALWCYELCQSNCSDPDTQSSLITSSSHSEDSDFPQHIPWALRPNRKWHSSHRLWRMGCGGIGIRCCQISMSKSLKVKKIQNSETAEISIVSWSSCLDKPWKLIFFKFCKIWIKFCNVQAC